MISEEFVGRWGPHLTIVSNNFAISVVRTLRSRGYQAYLVGGCVRDLLLGREPADYDVATDAAPDEVMRIFPDTYAVGAQFGVVLVPIPEQQRTSDSLKRKSSAEVGDIRAAPEEPAVGHYHN